MRSTIHWLPLLLGGALLLAMATGPVRAESHPKIDPADGWKSLLADKSLSNWRTQGKWTLDERGVLTHVSGGDIWTAEPYGDFMLDLEFKVAPATNSGVGIRCVSPVPRKKGGAWFTDGALEVQILAPNDHHKPDKQDCGSIFDVMAASKIVQKPVGQWNRYTIIAKGNRIRVIFNGERVIDMNVNDWPEAHKNPDGTRNKYPKAIKDMPRTGHILLQYHGQPIWFRNIHVRNL
jgi:hypothetical protein